MNPEPETRDDQGMHPDLTAMAEDLALKHWTGFTGPYTNAAINLLQFDDDGFAKVRAADLVHLVRTASIHSGIHHFKHGIEWERDRLRNQ